MNIEGKQSVTVVQGAWPKLAAPVAPCEPHQLVQLGRTRVDDYAWMKFIPASGTRTMDNLPTKLGAHLQAEMAYADAMLQPLADDIAWFRERFIARSNETADLLATCSNGSRYEAEQQAHAVHRVFTRVATEGNTEVLFDEAERAAGHAYYRATGHQPSPDDRYFAWAEDVIGDDRHRICVLDRDSGDIRTIVEADAFGYGGFTFSPSSRFVFWIWRDEHSRPTRLYRTSVDGGNTVLVYEERDPSLFMQIGRTAADGFVVLMLIGPDVSEARLIAASDELAALKVLRPRHRGTRYQIDEWQGELIMLTTAGGATDGKLVTLDPTTFAERRTVVTHRAGRPILAIQPFADALVRLERVEGLHQLVVMAADGREWPVAFDEPAYSIEVVPGQAYQSEQVRIVHQSPATMRRWIDVHFATGEQRVVRQDHFDGFDSNAYQLERLYAKAEDGETIPITVLSRKDAQGPLPLLLTGYGAYGFSLDPNFSLPATVLVDAGFRYAIAHVRGGSEKGWRWYQDGCRMKKRNSMTDFIACARHLQEIGYAAKGRIVAHGVSAGGLLVCGAMNIAPELWAGVIAEVPFVDMLNTMSDADHPLVPLLRPDWGDPLSDPEAYDYIAGISPYENVRRAAYPPVLCTAGLKDDRVPYWEPAKLVANIRRRSTSGNPAILALDPDSGHQGSGDQESEFAKFAELWAFAKHCVALAD